MAVQEGKVLAYLLGDRDLLRTLELVGSDGRTNARRDKKLREVAGFCEVILHEARPLLDRSDDIGIIEFSAGKSYLSLVLARALEELEGKSARIVGVDWSAPLIEKCRALAERAGVRNARYVAVRSLEFESDERFDLAVALHACDTATDEAIAKAIMLLVPHILVVPCCQNQIRGQIRSGHPLTVMSQYGPIRYRLANMLTDVLRAQFLHSAGYVVEMQEIGSPRLTPKNLCICARKSRRLSQRAQGRDQGYRALKSFFGVKPKIEALCPGVIGDG
jgi:hypothetical protein